MGVNTYQVADLADPEINLFRYDIIPGNLLIHITCSNVPAAVCSAGMKPFFAW